VWEEYSDTVEENDRTPNSYAQSLYRARVFDKWTIRVIEKMLEHPQRIHWWHVEALAAFVSALTLESARCDQRGGAPC
ncbi:MAG: hypothetical protein KDA37_18060, partial [Planctomycetales bacterium]|nr:hypothetical protein [Planctomycetales bacterium]